MAETRRRFDPEFRDGAVRIVRETGKSIAQVARDLGINDGTLANWVKKDREQRGRAAAGLALSKSWTGSRRTGGGTGAGCNARKCLS
jgi:transposase